MDSRERVFLALNYEEPDRVPVDFWASAGAWKVISHSSGEAKNDFLDTRDVDLRYIDGPVYTGDPIAVGYDIWGVRRSIATVKTRFGTEHYSENVTQIVHAV